MINLDRVCPHDKKLVIELAKSNMSASVIGNKFGFRAPKVVAICNEAGVKVRYRERRSNNATLEAMIKQQRYSARFIASTLGMCENTVRDAQKRLGLTYSEAVKKRNEKVKIAHRLRLDGMSAVDACKQAGITVSMYSRLKYQIGLVKKGA
jgi:hypothetical protein